MASNNDAAYKEESERLSYTLQYVEKSLNGILEKKERVDSEVNRLSKHLGSDSSTEYSNLLVYKTIQSSTELKLRNLLTSRSKPYFARVDFKEEDKNTPEKLYIGKMSLMRDEDQELVIVDWRAPIANLYYEGRLGDASYPSPGGEIVGELFLKRQFFIEKGELQAVFDIDVTTSDEFLQSYLGANADNRLKDIVSSIQAEQNKIIRADMWRPLIVQGAAGSGKTTIALHRIAYLIYTYEKSFSPENFMIIAPNRLFLNYISEVLPELGVERVRQTTFEDFALELIGTKLKIRDFNEKLVMFVNDISKDQAEKNIMIRGASELKSSILFKDILDGYVQIIEQVFIPKEDFKIASHVIYKYEEINNLFLNEYSRWPLMQRIKEIKKHLSNRLKAKKDSIVSLLNEQCDRRVAGLKEGSEEPEKRQKLIIQAIDRRTKMIEEVEAQSKKAVNEYVKKIKKINPDKYYKDLMADAVLLKNASKDRVDNELLEFISKYTSDMLKKGFIEIEDVAPIVYLKYRIFGMDEKIAVRHIIIDEAQDFSVFQFLVLRKIVKDSSFTILGDLCQGIHYYRGTRDWEEVRNFAFEGEKSEFLTLEKSYRTTVEIMEAANKVISKSKDTGLITAKPVIRHGEEVRIFKRGSLEENASSINENINDFKNQGYKTIAVICKSMNECEMMSKLLGKFGSSPVIITGKEDEYKSGIVIVPSYLAKGLEFDAVLISDASMEKYSESELDIKLLYVAMTRPLHKLYIYYVGELSPLLA